MKYLSWLLALALVVGQMVPVGANGTVEGPFFETVNFSIMPADPSAYDAHWGSIELMYAELSTPLNAESYADPAIVVYGLPNATALAFSATPLPGYRIASFSFDFYDLSHGPIPAFDFHLTPGFDPYQSQTLAFDLFDPDIQALIPELDQLNTTALITIDARVMFVPATQGYPLSLGITNSGQGAIWWEMGSALMPELVGYLERYRIDTRPVLATGTERLASGTPINVWMQPLAGYRLSYVSLNDQVMPYNHSLISLVDASANIWLLSVSMPEQNSTLWVSFVPLPPPPGIPQLTYGIASDQGSITLTTPLITNPMVTVTGSSRTTPLLPGDMGTLSIAPLAGYQLSTVTQNGVVLPLTDLTVIAGVYHLSFEMPSTDLAVWVYFAPDIYNFSFGVDSGQGSVRYLTTTITTPMMDHRWVEPGTYMEVIIGQTVPNYRLIDVIISGLDSFILRYDHVGHLLYSFYMPDQDVSIAGVFAHEALFEPVVIP